MKEDPAVQMQNPKRPDGEGKAVGKEKSDTKFESSGEQTINRRSTLNYHILNNLSNGISPRRPPSLSELANSVVSLQRRVARGVDLSRDSHGRT